MLASYGRPHRRADIASAVSLCRKHGMKVMLDLLLGGPGETEDTLRDTVEFMRTISPDCVGAALGVRVYPGTQFADMVEREGPLTSNRSLRFGQTVATDSAEPRLRPVFYVSRAIGDAPAQLIRRLIAGDPRFFEPVDEQIAQNYNYNDNLPLCEAIRKGARGAYWDILRQMRHC
jgi:radical SAM superfamily enzyme YgiQ (UPF0313 family)